MTTLDDSDHTKAQHPAGTQNPKKWSGEPNGSLVVEISDTPPGKALDIGCGEGGDALWLATLGWEVTAVDTSAARIEHGRRSAQLSSLNINFLVADITMDLPTTDRYDLVILSYPGIERVSGKSAMPVIIESVARGGELLVIGHAHSEKNKLKSTKQFDPELFLSVDDIAELLHPTFALSIDEVRERPNPPKSTTHFYDRILRARRIS